MNPIIPGKLTDPPPVMDQQQTIAALVAALRLISESDDPAFMRMHARAALKAAE